MRTVLPAVGLFGAIVWSAGGAGAQQSATPAKYKPQPLLLQHEQLGSDVLAGVGRTRMHNGDWAGALDAFDVVLRSAADPTVSRDRGICHEQLGHVFPAIDDYRAYVTAMPDAPDADGVRQRLARLEQQGTGRSSASSDVPGDVAHGDGIAGGSAGTAPTAPARSLSRAAADQAGQPRDKMDYIDRDDDTAARSPFRWSRGFTLSPFLEEHKWLGGGGSFGDANTWSESVGLELRYSVAGSGALFVAGGYEHFNATAVDPATLGGLTAQVGYEFRFSLDPDADDQLLLSPAVGYEHLAVTPTDPQFSNQTVGAIVPRMRLGYRHMIAAAVALDLGIDGGYCKYFEYGSPGAGGVSSATQQLLSSNVLVAAGVALGWAL
jgi:hypothetical protein